MKESWEIVVEAAEKMRTQRQRAAQEADDAQRHPRHKRAVEQRREAPALVYACECGGRIVCGISADWKKKVGICALCGLVLHGM